MRSERRLHPLSFLFTLGSQARNLLLPGLAVLFTARTSEWGWEQWAMIGFVPVALGTLFHYLFYRYRYDETEMVIRSGLLFRNERHVPYGRIQNIDAVQNVLHRLLGVAEVRVETGGGSEPEATMRVLPVAAFEEMRRRVFDEAGRGGRSPAAGTGAADVRAAGAPAARTLLNLPLRELLLAGFIENRGIVVVAASFGLLWEFGLADRIAGRMFGGGDGARGVAGELFRALVGRGAPPLGRIALTLAAFLALFVVMRIASMAWAAVRLHGFTLTRVGGDLRTRYGLLTRVSTTIPLHRIQTLTIREGPLHRLLGRASVRVDTAGGGGGQTESQREWLAPIVKREEVLGLLRDVMPELDLDEADWRKAPPRAFRRELRQGLVLAVAGSALLLPMLRWWDAVLFGALSGWAFAYAKLYVAHLGHAVTDRTVLFRSGWLWRDVTAARFAKIQAVSLHQSPFDRRAAMARLHVDTAGAGETSHRVHIPYLEVAEAQGLLRQLSAQAARIPFRW